MRRRPPQLVQSRTIIGVIALYALLLQAFLAFAAPALSPDPTGSVLCAEHGSGAPADDQADVQCHACCAAVHIGNLAPPPLDAFPVLWPFQRVARVVWRPEAEVLKTGPPTHAQSARGPPIA
jgi:hypothetical protein